MVHLARLIPALHLASHVFLNLNSSFLSIATGTKHKQTKICQRADIESNVSSQELVKPCTSPRQSKLGTPGASVSWCKFVSVGRYDITLAQHRLDV